MECKYITYLNSHSKYKWENNQFDFEQKRMETFFSKNKILKIMFGFYLRAKINFIPATRQSDISSKNLLKVT